jgi:cytochrome c556
MTRRLVLVTALVVAVSGFAPGLAGFGGTGFGGSALAQGIDPIATRQVGLDLLNGTFAGVKAVITTKGDVKTLEAPGKAIQRWGTVFPTLFPEGSDKGNTKAAPAIWTDMEGFKKDATALSVAGEALATAAKAGDEAAAAAAFKQIGDACGACHKEYRLK